MVTKVRKLGTGSVDSNAIGSRKWTQGVKAQIDGTGELINTRLVPMATITLDVDNPRTMAISADEVHTTVLRCPIPPAWLSTTSPVAQDWEDYCASVQEHLSAVKATEYVDLVLLALSIKEPEQLINPVTVYVGESGTDLRMIAGERRYLAHVVLQQPNIVARILANKPNRFEIDIMQWQENTQRKDLSLHDTIMNVDRLAEGWRQVKSASISVRELVALAGISRTNAHRFLSVIKSANRDAILELIKNGEITSISKAAHLGSMSRAEFAAFLKPKEAQPQRRARFKIQKSVPLAALQSLVTQAVLACGERTLVDSVKQNPPSSVDDCAQVFDQLLQAIEENQSKQ
ncbi:MAG: hypothetical protein AAF542_21935 [Pseudomonadota bacterium]